MAFVSAADDLVPGDHNGTYDVFVRDLVAGTTRLVSINDAGTGSGNSRSDSPSMSGDGRYIAFVSGSSNLVAESTGLTLNVFVRDLAAGTTRLVSGRCDGSVGGNSVSWSPSISADGRFVGFSSRTTDLTPDSLTGSVENVFRHDLFTGETVLCSRGRGGGGANTNSFPVPPALSADGRSVAFFSEASNLMARDDNGSYDLFAWTERPPISALSAVAINGTFYVTWVRSSNDCTLLSSRTLPATTWSSEVFTDFGLEKVHVRRIDLGSPMRFYRLNCP